MNNINRDISELSSGEWARVRHHYYISSQPMDMGNAKIALFEFDEILKDMGINYFLTCGTALGFYRDGNFIAWDDEIDVDILAEIYVDKFYEMKERFISEGFVVRAAYRGPGGITSKMAMFKYGIKIATSGLFDDGNGFRCAHMVKYPANLFLKGEYFSYKGVEFLLPSPIEEYLTFFYGNWETPIKSYNPSEYLNKDGQWRK
tara:strand:+ start:130 stop:738 length:609 start_codon:yes stop_codon:yes gene_type:complete